MSEARSKGFIESKWDTIVETGWTVQKKIDEWTKRFGKRKYGRVIKMARKPDYDEFVKTSFIAGIGVVIIGAIGYLVYFLYKYIPEWLNL